MALDCLEYYGRGDDAVHAIARQVATMRDARRFADEDAGFVSLLARKAHCGAKPYDYGHYAAGLNDDVWADFVSGMLDAVADLSEQTPSDRLYPHRIISRVQTGILHSEKTPQFAGYVVTIAASAINCGNH